MWIKVKGSVELGYASRFPFTISVVDGKMELAQNGLVYAPIEVVARPDGTTLYAYGLSAPVRELLLVRRGNAWWVAIHPTPPDDEL